MIMPVSGNKKILTLIIAISTLFILSPTLLSGQILGDVNTSGNTDIVDALVIAQFYVGLNPENFESAVADVDSNNTIDIVDSLLIAQLYVGLIDQLPGALPTDNPTPVPPDNNNIQLNANSITATGSGTVVNGSTVTITSAGTYNISGTLNNGRVIVDTDDEGLVVLNLNGIDIYSAENSPLSIMNAPDGVEIYLGDNTTNYLSDSSSYFFDTDDDEPNATLFSKDDMDITGEGTLIIDANYNDGISCKDDMNIKDCTIEVTAVDDGIRGKNSLEIKGGCTITVNSGGDCLKSDDAEDALIEIKKCNLILTSGNADAMDSELDITITNDESNITITAGGGSNRTPVDGVSTKGIKAGRNIIIEAGAINIDSSDDAIHSGETLDIMGGVINISTGDDGVHGESVLNVNGGEIYINDSYEGLEAPTLTLNNGSAWITADDDAINAAGGNNNNLYMNGGYWVLHVTNTTIPGSTGGDAMDCNGYITTTGGTILIHGQTASMDSAIDYDRGFTNNGGFILGVGSSRMAMIAGSNNSSQNALLYNFSSQPAGTLFSIRNSNGQELVTFLNDKDFSSITFSSPELINGQSYNIYFNGNYSGGTQADGLFQNGTYNPGTLSESFTVTGPTTEIGSGGWNPFPW